MKTATDTLIRRLRIPAIVGVALVLGATLRPGSETPDTAAKPAETSHLARRPDPIGWSVAAPLVNAAFDRDQVLALLEEATDPAVLELVEEAMREDSISARAAIADRLGARGGHDAVGALLRLAALEAGAEARASMLEGLRNVTDAEGLEAVASVLATTQEPQFVEAAKETLGRAADGASILALVDFYRERTDRAQQKNAVLDAIAASRNPDAVGVLRKLALQAPEPGLADAAAQALAFQAGASERLLSESLQP